MNIKRIYNRNRKSIWTFIVIVVFIIILIQLLNYFAKQNRANQGNNVQSTETTNSTQNKISVGNSTVVTNTTSSVTGSSISTEKLTTTANTINQFVEYCNEGNVESAYNLLTDECKEKLYPTLNDFKNNYYKNTFKTTLICEISNWMGDTYLVKLKEDSLATGNVSDGYIEEYITLKKVDNTNKLNISNYIGQTKINETTQNKNISVTVVSKDTFVDYEEYNLIVKNNSDKTIALDSLESTETIYLQDSSNVKYSSYSHEILKENMIIKSKYTKEFSIKFSNSYSSSRKINKLVFTNLILDYNEYSLTENKSDYKDIYRFEAST